MSEGGRRMYKTAITAAYVEGKRDGEDEEHERYDRVKHPWNPPRHSHRLRGGHSAAQALAKQNGLSTDVGTRCFARPVCAACLGVGLVIVERDDTDCLSRPQPLARAVQLGFAMSK